MSEIKLREYQQKFISEIRDAFKAGHRRVVGVAPCGAGKTIVAGWMIRENLNRDQRSIFFVHRKELIEQTSATFRRLGIEHGIIAAGEETDYQKPVQIASVQTLIRRLDLIDAPDFMICDECHHILANSYQEITKKFKDAYLLGLTATPQRMGGKTLFDAFDSIVQAPSVADLIKLGNLAEFDYYSMDFDRSQLDKIKLYKGDYLVLGLSRLMINPIVTRAIIDSYKMHAAGKSAICYCVNVAHSKHVAAYFNAAGIPTAHCDATTPKAERAEIISDFRAGRYKILCNAELFGEGFDVPNCHAVILARPTKSLTLYVQQSMRSMRPDPEEPNKVAVIIDCVKNYVLHGQPDSARNWTLDENEKKTGTVPLKECPQCHKVVPITTEICPACKKVLIERTPLVNVKTAVKIHSSKDQKGKPTTESRTIKKRKKSLEYFAEIGRRKGYKPYWAVINALKYVTTYDEIVHIAEIMGYHKGWAKYRAEELGIPIILPSENKSSLFKDSEVIIVE